MYHVYTIKKGSELSKTLIKETKDFEEAMDTAVESVENNPELDYIVEETTGHVNSYGDLEVNIVSKS